MKLTTMSLLPIVKKLTKVPAAYDNASMEIISQWWPFFKKKIIKTEYSDKNISTGNKINKYLYKN